MLSIVQTLKSKLNLIYFRSDPNLVIYADAIAPNTEQAIPANDDRKNNYGFFDLYPAVYPSVVPYPASYECWPETAKASRPPASASALPPSAVLSPSHSALDLRKSTSSNCGDQCSNSP